MVIGFNKPYFTGKEEEYVHDAVKTGKISGNGKYTKLCQTFFEKKYGFGKCLLTTSCTDALEMAAILLNIQEGDEVIVPSYTFVSSANAFVLRGAKIVFVDVQQNCPTIDVEKIEELITPKTKVIVPVHYAGIACDMDTIMAIANKYNLYVVEDAAPAIDSYYINKNGVKKALGSIGHLAAFSFHETKNVICGEGGMLVINDTQFEKRAEIIWEKGTNRSAFYKGEVDKYNWVDIGSSFLPSDITAAFLYAQIENIDVIQVKRKQIWDTYYSALQPFADKLQFNLPYIPNYATNNAHAFYITFSSIEKRTEYLTKLNKHNIHAVFHYLSLHKSPFYVSKYGDTLLPMSEFYSDSLLRLPMYYELSDTDIQNVITTFLSND